MVLLTLVICAFLVTVGKKFTNFHHLFKGQALSSTDFSLRVFHFIHFKFISADFQFNSTVVWKYTSRDHDPFKGVGTCFVSWYVAYPAESPLRPGKERTPCCRQVGDSAVHVTGTGNWNTPISIVELTISAFVSFHLMYFPLWGVYTKNYYVFLACWPFNHHEMPFLVSGNIYLKKPALSDVKTASLALHLLYLFP